MTYLHKKIDALTGEENIEPYTQDEMDELMGGEIKAEERKVELEAKAKEKAALLAKLGITEEEAKLLLS
jgi:hypothetical protein